MGSISSPIFTNHFGTVPKMEEFWKTYISCMYTAYVREFSHPKKWPWDGAGPSRRSFRWGHGLQTKPWGAASLAGGSGEARCFLCPLHHLQNEWRRGPEWGTTCRYNLVASFKRMLQEARYGQRDLPEDGQSGWTPVLGPSSDGVLRGKHKV